jgi:hypothetical protein
VFALLCIVYLLLPAVGSPSNAALASSLEWHVGLSPEGPCESLAETVHRCGVWDSEGSGVVYYRVTVEGRCWKAREVAPLDPEAKPRAAGCVTLHDQVRLLDRLFGSPYSPSTSSLQTAA